MKQPTAFVLMNNLKTAKTIDLSIPQSVLNQADRVTKSRFTIPMRWLPIVVLNILDAFLTIMILDLGGWEVNHIVGSAIEVYGDNFWLWKFVICSACVVVFCLHSEFTKAKLILLSLNILYISIVFYNALLIIYG